MFGAWTHFSEKHENDVRHVEVKRRHHVLVEGDKLMGRCVWGEEGGNKRTKKPLLQDGLQDTIALICISLDKNLQEKKKIKCS